MSGVCLLGDPRYIQGQQAVRLPAEAPLWLLAFLASHDHQTAREELLELLYPEVEEGAARNRLRNLLHRLRSLPWGGGLQADAGGLHWSGEIDVRRLRQAFTAGRWETVLTLYRGQFLNGLRPAGLPAFEAWLDDERENLQTVWQEALLNHASELERCGQPGAALELLQRLLAADPYAEEALRVYLRAAVKDGQRARATQTYERFCTQLQRELGLEPERSTQELYAALLAGAVAAIPGLGRSGRGSGLPFFGREDELTWLREHLAHPEGRLLTLSGPGGAGKTRLAQEAALEQAAGGTAVQVMALESATSAGEVISAVAASLGLSPGGSEPPARQLLAALQAGQFLLVLDNLEQLLVGASRDEVLALLLSWLNEAPGVKLLITSRQRLGLQAEWVLPLGGLAFPGVPAAGLLARSSAVRLFVERAGRVRPGFALTAHNAPALLEICQLTGGLPLALELSAAWAGHLDAHEIAGELRASLDFASSAGPDRPERHRSLRAAFNHSWALLGPEERGVLARLTVFQGGFERAAAQRVAHSPLRVLLTLGDHSLVRRGTDGRYLLHEVVRQYAAEHLEALAQQAQATRTAHAAFFLALAQQAAPQLRGPEQAHWLERLATDHDNLRAALDWLVTGQDAARALGLACGLLWFWYVRGHHREGLARLETALKLPGGPDDARAEALYGAGWLARELGEYALARARLDEALVLCERLSLRRLAADVLHATGIVCRETGSLDEAQAFLQRAEAVQRDQAERWGLATSLNDLGVTWLLRGDKATARQYFQESLELKEALGDRQGIAYALANLGNAAQTLEEYQSLTARSLTIKRELGDRQGVGNSLFNLAEISLGQGHLKAARTLLGEALGLFWQLGRRRNAALALLLFAQLAAAEKRPELCLLLAGAADALAAASGFQLQSVDLAALHSALDQARTQLGPVPASAAYQQGQTWPLAAVIELALK